MVAIGYLWKDIDKVLKSDINKSSFYEISTPSFKCLN